MVDVRTIYRDHAKYASPVKWCLNEKVELLCKQSRTFAGWSNPTFPEQEEYTILSVCLSDQSYTWINVDRQGLVFFGGFGSSCVDSNSRTRWSGSKLVSVFQGKLRYSSARKTMFRCRFLAIVDVRTIYRDHAKYASPVKWCLNAEVELLCKLAMPRLSSGV